MRFAVLIAAALLLAGCAAVPYDPTPDIHDALTAAQKAQVAMDVTVCAGYAAQYHRPFNLAGVAAAGGQGAAANLSSAGVSGWVGPVLGGAGGLLAAIFQWVGLIDTDTPKADQECVRQRLDRDHAGILVEAPL